MKTSARFLPAAERLEDRIAPASLTLTDLDGDKVIFTASKGALDGLVTQTQTPDGLRSVFNLDLAASRLYGTDLTVSVKKGGAGDGKAIVGRIDGGLNDFGVVKIAGDLGDIDVGSSSPTVPAIKSLTVDSVGRFGERGGGNAYSEVFGSVGSLTVAHDFIATNFYVHGDLASVMVRGSIVGGTNTGDGQIFATGNLTKATIKKDIRGGGGDFAGNIGAGHDLGTVSIGGSIYGGGGKNSGFVYSSAAAAGKITKVTVGGSIFGGSGSGSGQIGNYTPAGDLFDATISTVTVVGSIVGGAGEFSGAIGNAASGLVPHVALGTVTIGKDLVGGSGKTSGAVASNSGGITRLTIKGSFVGGSGSTSGYIYANGRAGIVSIGHSVLGGAGDESATMNMIDGGTISIGGSILGASGIHSGSILVTNTFSHLDLLKIGGDVRGSTGNYSGSVDTYSSNNKTIIGGAIIAGTGTDSGVVN